MTKLLQNYRVSVGHEKNTPFVNANDIYSYVAEIFNTSLRAVLPRLCGGNIAQCVKYRRRLHSVYVQLGASARGCDI